MLPSGLLAAGFLLALIPGWLFLRWTESARRPRMLSSLQEVLELVTVGLLTSGAALLLLGLVCPSLLLRLAQSPDSAADVRWAMGVPAIALALAVLGAGLGALFTNMMSSATDIETVIGVWWGVLRREKVPEGKVPHVAVALADGSTADGVLAAFTWSPDATHRDIALRGPVRITSGGQVKELPCDRLIIPSDQIRSIALKYQPRGRVARH